MVSRNNVKMLDRQLTDRQVQHFGLRKTTLGLASVLLGTTFWFGGQAVAHADVAAPSAGTDNQTSESSNVQQPFSSNTNNVQANTAKQPVAASANIERTNSFVAVHPQSVANLAASLKQSLIQENNQPSSQPSSSGVTAGKVDGNAILPENSNSSYYSTIKLKDDTYLNTNGSAVTAGADYMGHDDQFFQGYRDREWRVDQSEDINSAGGAFYGDKNGDYRTWRSISPIVETSMDDFVKTLNDPTSNSGNILGVITQTGRREYIDPSSLKRINANEYDFDGYDYDLLGHRINVGTWHLCMNGNHYLYFDYIVPTGSQVIHTEGIASIPPLPVFVAGKTASGKTTGVIAEAAIARGFGSLLSAWNSADGAVLIAHSDFSKNGYQSVNAKNTDGSTNLLAHNSRRWWSISWGNANINGLSLNTSGGGDYPAISAGSIATSGAKTVTTSYTPQSIDAFDSKGNVVGKYEWLFSDYGHPYLRFVPTKGSAFDTDLNANGIADVLPLKFANPQWNWQNQNDPQPETMLTFYPVVYKSAPDKLAMKKLVVHYKYANGTSAGQDSVYYYESTQKLNQSPYWAAPQLIYQSGPNVVTSSNVGNGMQTTNGVTMLTQDLSINLPNVTNKSIQIRVPVDNAALSSTPVINGIEVNPYEVTAVVSQPVVTKTYVNVQYKNQVDGSIVQHGVVTVGSDGRLTYQAPAGYQMVNADQLPVEVRTDSNNKLHYYLSNGHETTDANLITSQVIPADNRLAPQTETDSVSSNVQRSELRQAIHFDQWALSTNVPTVKFNSQTTTDYVPAAKAGDQFMQKYNLPNDIGNQNMSNCIDSAKVTGSGVIATATFSNLGQTYYTDAQGHRTQIGKIVRTYYDMDGNGRLGIFVSSMKLSDENNHSPFYSNLVLFDGAKAVSFKTDYYDLYGNKINLPDNEDIFAMTNMAIDNFRGNDGRNHSRNYRGVIETSGTTVVGMPRTTHQLNYTYSTDPRKTIIVVGGSNHGVRVGLLNTDAADQNQALVGSDSGNIFSQAYQLDNQVPYDHIRQVTAKRTINFLTDSVLGTGDKDALSDPVVQTIVWTGFEKNGQVVAGDLQQAKQFPAYQLPVIDGYHPEQITEVPAESLNPNQDNGAKSYNGVYNVFYSRPEQISTVTVPVIQNGAHWTVKPGEVDPNVMHGVDPNSLVRDVTRTINVINPDKSVKSYTQTAHFTRNAEVDMLTNKIKFDNWMPASVNLAAFNLPTIAGYAPDKTIDAVVVTPDTKDSMVNVSYVAQNQSFKVNYVDVTNNQVVKSDVINGKTDETVNVTVNVPAGYQLVSGQHTLSSVILKSSDNADITVKVSQKVDTLDPNKPSTWPSGVKASDFRREIVYSISTSLPNNGGAMANHTTADFTRDVNYNEATKQIVYGPWSNNGKSTLMPPTFEAISGYKMSKTFSPVDVTPDSQNISDSFDWLPEDQSFKINYVNVNNNNQLVETDVIKGKTDQTVNLDYSVPAHYVLVAGQDLPKAVTMKANGNSDIVAKVAEATTDFSSSTPEGQLPAGVHHSDFERTVQRDVYLKQLDGTVKPLANQLVVFTRAATYNQATGKLTFAPWSENGQHIFPKVDVPQVAGYQVVGPVLDAETVTPDTKSQSITLSYDPLAWNFKEIFVDMNADNKVVKTVNLNGKTGETVKLDQTLPDGYQLVHDETLPATVTISVDGQHDVTVRLAQKVDTIDPNNSKTWPVGVTANDFKRTINRTIVVIQPDGTKRNQTQTVTFARNVKYNEVTKQVAYDPWSENGSHQFTAVTAPVIVGYQADKSAEAITVTPDSKDSTVEINYIAQAQSFKINYVDVTANNKLVKSDVVSGKTDQTVGVNINVPAGYQLVENQNLPKTVKLAGSGNADLTVKLTQKIDAIDPNNSKTWPDGLHESDLKRVITRDVKITDPDGKANVTHQTVTFVRSGNYNEITKQVSYDPWSEGGSHQFAAVTAPAIAGYQADKSAETITVTPDSKDSTVEINYIAQAQSFKINYVDATDNNKLVKSDVVNGKTDQTVNVNINVPAGYQLVANQNLPKTVKLSGSGNADLTVKLMQKVDAIDPNDPNTWPNGLHESDLKRVITRDVKITDPDGKVNTTHQTVTFVRGGNYNEITKQVAYDPWSENGSHQFTAVMAPVIAGYQADKSAEAIMVTPDSKDSTVEINYIAQAQSFKINYVDVTNNQVVKSDVVNGKTDQTVDVNINVPTGYQLVENQNLPKTVKLSGNGNADLTVKLTQKIDAINPNDPNTWPNGLHESDLKRVITRDVKITDPDGKANVTHQTVTFVRGGNYNEIAKQVAYDPWSENGSHQFAAVTAPVIVGYQADKSAEAITVTPDSKDSTVEINYVAQAQSFKINYVDVTDNNKLVKSDVVNGKTDQTVNVNINVPVGYQLVADQNLPKTVKLAGSGNADLAVKLTQKVDTIDPNNSKTWPVGVTADDFKRTISRTIVIIQPDGTKHNQTQTVTFVRGGNYNEITKQVTYDPWSENGSHQFVAVTASVIAGYQPDKSAEAITVTPDSKDSTVEINYIAQAQSFKINYVDVTANNKLVKSDVVNGKTDQTVNVNINVPSGYQLAENQNLPKAVKLSGNGNADLTVKLTQKVDAIDPNDPNTWPDGLHESDLKRVITRDVKITDPDGKANTTHQTVTFVRNGKYNEVTKQIAYDPWSENGSHQFAAVTASVIAGYQPDKSAEAITVTPDSKDSTVEINYIAQAQSFKINYVDVTANNKLVKSDVVNGKTDQTVNVNINVPAGYQLVENQNLPTTVKLAGSGNADLTVKLTQKVDAIDPNDPSTWPNGLHESDLKRVITRDVNITDPDGKINTTHQTVTFVRGGNYNEITKQVAYDPWSEGGSHQFAAVDVPTVAGYAPSQSVPVLTVTPDSSDVTESVTYRALDQSIAVHFVDAQNKHITDQLLAGKTGQTIEVKLNVPTGWQVVAGQHIPKTVTLQGKDNSDLTVALEHIVTPVDPTDSKTIPAGYPLKDTDWKRDIVRIVNITDPQGKKQTQTQQVEFKRSVAFDQVTHQYQFGTWSENGQHQFAAIVAPAVAGYVINGSASAEVVTPDSKSETVDISYVANGQSAVYRFVDDDLNGKVVGEDHAIAGKTDSDVKLNIQLPAGYQLAQGQTLPDNYHFKAANNDPLVIHLVHVQKDATNDPKADTSRMITRTIEIINPDGKATIDHQAVKFTRTAKQDAVTGQYSYGAWSNNGQQRFEAYVQPDLKGYNKTGSAPQVTVTPDSKDFTLQLGYQKQADKLIDPNDPSTWPAGLKASDLKRTITRKVTINVPGKEPQVINQTVTFTRGGKIDPVTDQITWDAWSENGSHQFAAVNVPTVKGYDPSQKTIEAVIVTPDSQLTGSEVTINYTKQADKLIDPNDPSTWPNGVKASDLKRTITRKVTINVPGKEPQVINQTVTFTRTGHQDPVTDQITWDAWSENGKHQFAAVNVPTVKGYDPSQKAVDTLTVTPDSQSVEVTISYTKQADKTIDPNDSSTWPNGVKASDLKRTISRKVTINVPGKEPQVINQTVTFTRLGHQDPVTDRITWDNWSENGKHHFAAVNVPDVKGYNPSQKTIEAVTVTPDSRSTESEVTINYTKQADKTIDPNDPSTWPNGVKASDLKRTISRKVTINVPGKDPQVINQTVTFTRGGKLDSVTDQITWDAWSENGSHQFTAVDVPTVKGYDPSQKVVDTLTVTPDSQSTEVTISYTKQADKTIDPNDPSTWPAGLKASDLKRTISRKVTINVPGKEPQVINQTVTFTRVGHQDPVTDQITWDSWSENGKHHFDSVNVPAVKGYDPSQKTIEAVTVTPDSQSIEPEVTINYTKQADKTIDPNDPSTWPNGVKASDLKRTITRKVTINVPGKDPQVINQTVTFTRGGKVDPVTDQITWDAWSENGKHHFNSISVPTVKGYDPSQKTIEAVTVTPDSRLTESEVTINYIKQADKTIDPNDPSTWPNGVKASDLKLTITRKVTINVPGKEPQVINQTVAFTRGGKVDPVTDRITWDSWSENGKHQFDSISVPTVKGYDPSQKTIEAVTVTPDSQSTEVTINYTKQADKTIDPNDPSTWPNGVKASDLKRTVARKVTINVPGKKPQVINQTVTFTRVGHQDSVTDQITWDSWSENGKHQFEAVNVPTVKGYDPSQKTIEAVTVTPDSQSTEVTINYTKQADKTIDPNDPSTWPAGLKASDLKRTISRTINITTPDGKTKTIKQTVTFTRGGKIDPVTDQITWNAWSENGKHHFDSVNVPTVKGYSANPSTIAGVDVTPDTQFGGQANVKVSYHKEANLILDVDHPENWPKGITADDFKKTVTRTIVFKLPSGDHTKVQTVTLTRTGELDPAIDQVIWHVWSNGQFDAVEVPVVDGYTASMAEVPAMQVNGDTQAVTVTVNYLKQTADKPKVEKPQVSAPLKSSNSSTSQADVSANAPVAAVNVSGPVTGPQQTQPTVRQLPQTGNSEQAAMLMLAGMTIMLGAACLKRKH